MPPVYGDQQIACLNSGKMYLSFSRTRAGHVNVKVGLFEAIACGTCLVTQVNPDLEDYFHVGTEVLCYSSTKELIDLVRFHLKNPTRIEWLKKNASQRFFNEHTWKIRWNNVLTDIEKLRNELKYAK
ncbi:hypothetical protein D3C87_1797830 [compost metagenome]